MVCNYTALGNFFMIFQNMQMDWCPKYEATGKPHYREVVGENIYKNDDGYWDV